VYQWWADESIPPEDRIKLLVAMIGDMEYFILSEPNRDALIELLDGRAETKRFADECRERGTVNGTKIVVDRPFPCGSGSDRASVAVPQQRQNDRRLA
jgi:hypothetical protein